VKDGAESAVDVADMRVVKNGGLDGLGDLNVDRHGSSPSPSPAQERTVRESLGAGRRENGGGFLV
jgi:hypothetical protein